MVIGQMGSDGTAWGPSSLRHYRSVIRRQFSRASATDAGNRGRTPEGKWFWDHYAVAARQIVDFCSAGGVDLEGRELADVGCGDGMMALGLCHLVRPRRLTGFDVVLTNSESLLARAREEGVADSLPAQLEFRESTIKHTPAPDDSFDFVYSWSAFEHIEAPSEVLREIRRILRPHGCFFLQLWPFYHSAQGSHLWDWFDDDFHHLVDNDVEMLEKMRASGRHSQAWTDYMSTEFQALNRIRLDELQRAVVAAGFHVGRLELLASPATVMAGLEHYAWSDLGVSGIKLLASPSR